jgi:hypothetical protein
VKAKHLEGSLFMDCGSDLGSARHVPGKGLTSSLYTYKYLLIYIFFVLKNLTALRIK